MTTLTRAGRRGMERHKRKARLAQAAQQNFRHSLASTHRHSLASTHTHTQDTCLQRRYISTRTSTRFIFLRTCAQQTRATWDPLKAGGCVFLRRTDDGSAHHTQHVLLQTAARRTMTHINTHTTRLHGRLSPERHGGCKLFPFTYPNKPRLV